MEALSRQGNRAAALAQYEVCRTALLKQLGTEPDRMTTALFESIRDAVPEAATKPISEVSETPAETIAASARVVPANIEIMGRSVHPLVGRGREYAHTVDALRQAIADGHNHVVLLHGEAGIGKTRLLTEMVDATTTGRLGEPDFGTLLVGRAYESMLGVLYAMFSEALEGLLPAVELPALALPDAWMRELGRLLPDVFVQRPDLEAPAPMSSGDDRLRLFQAVSRFLASLPQPVLFALDDLQWADPLTMALLAYLVRLVSDKLRLAAVVTVRAGDDSDATRLLFRSLEREGLLTRVELTNLTEHDTVTLVKALFPEGDPEHGLQVFSHSHGHPLHTVELVSMLREAENADSIIKLDAEIKSGRQNVRTAKELRPLPVPPTVQDVFVGRLARLGDVAARLAEALAVLHRGATADQLCYVAELNEAEAVSGINALIEAYIATERSDGYITFKHEVFSHVVMQRLSGPRRRYVHRRAYAALTRELPDTSGAGASAGAPDGQRLADLIDQSIGGHMWEDAVRWTEYAADVAERLYAFPAAVAHLRTMLGCLAKLPASDERRKQSLDVDLRIAKLDYWSPPDERDARLASIAESARAYGATSHLPLIHLAQAESYVFQGRCTEAATLLNDLAPLAARDPRLAIRFTAWRGAIDAIVGDARQALVHLHEVRRATEGQVLKPGTSVYAGMAACYASLGDFDEADAAMAAMAQEEQQQGYQGLTSKFLTVAATVAYLRGQWKQAAEHARRGMLTSRAAEDPYNEALSGLWFGASQIELGAPAEAVRSLKAALSASEKAQTYTRRDFIYAYLALAYLQAGFPERAEHAVLLGLATAQRFGYNEGYALGKEMQGRIAAAQDDPRQAREHVTDALKRFESLSAVAGIARCRAHLDALDRNPPNFLAGQTDG